MPLQLLGLGLFAIFVCRLFFHAVQTAPSLPARSELEPPPAPPVLARSRRSLIPSRLDKLDRAIELFNRETDLALANTNAVRASAGLAQARAELATVIRDLSRQPDPPVPIATAPALTQSEITQLVDLLDLAPETRSRLQTLVAARIEEKRS